MQYPESSYLRLKNIVGDPEAKPPIPALIPVCPSTWWAWVASGKAPKPIKLSERVTVWRLSDIKVFIEEQSREAGQ